jgi:hypothetical protein
LTISIGASYGMDTIGIDAFFASALLL